MDAAKENKLEKFLKDQNIEATVEEVKKYVIEVFTSKDGELSKGELDLAAGGKDHDTKVSWAVLSVFGLGIGCAVCGIVGGVTKKDCMKS